MVFFYLKLHFLVEISVAIHLDKLSSSFNMKKIRLTILLFQKKIATLHPFKKTICLLTESLL